MPFVSVTSPSPTWEINSQGRKLDGSRSPEFLLCSILRASVGFCDR